MAGEIKVEQNNKSKMQETVTEQGKKKAETIKPNEEQVVMNGHDDVTAAEDSKATNGNPPESQQEGETAADEEGDGSLVVQDVPFVIKIQCPGEEPFDLPVSSMELAQEIHQLLIDREESCHRTCFSLQLDGQTLDNFSELKAVEGLKEGSVLQVVEEPYTMREARLHVRCIRDLLKSVRHDDAYNGIECSSLSFLSVVTSGDIMDKKRTAGRNSPKQESAECMPPDYVLPGSKDRPLMPMHPGTKQAKHQPIQCLKVLTSSGWNPPPGNRRMHGDLLYLDVVTLEDKRYHITSSTRGFFVNQSTLDEFNPRPAPPKHTCHSLIDLLNQISPMFKRNFAQLLKQRSQLHPFERVATPYQIYTWMSPGVPHTVDSIRAEDAFSSRLGYEEHIPGQTRDWNEELQLTREHPRKQLADRLIRERAIFKVHSDFVVAATRGAMSVVDGNIMAINPGDDSKMQMFLWNNIFFSLGFDVKDHYKEFGGDAAAHIAPGNDLKGVKAYAGIDIEGLYTLGTVVIDYRGYRVTAQSIIPGILEKEQEQSVVYGSVDFGKTVVVDDKYKELLAKTLLPLKIRSHKVKNAEDEIIEIYSSVECKGIIGNDKRHYILDLLRTFPPDVNFLPGADIELSDDLKQMGFPLKHRHNLPCLRQELIDAFIESRYVTFVKLASFQLQQHRMKALKEQAEKKEKEAEEKKEIENGEAKEEEEEKSAEGTTADAAATADKTDAEKSAEATDKLIKAAAAVAASKSEDGVTDAKKMVEAMTNTDTDPVLSTEQSTEIVRKAALEVGSLSDTQFDLSFNSDVFQPHVKHADLEMYNKEKQLVADAGQFLVLRQIPAFIRDCMEHSSSPIDGFTLTEHLHQSGINMRYLGKVTELVAKYPELAYIKCICIGELLTRSAKYLFKQYMQNVELLMLAPAVAHFLNCYLGSTNNLHPNIHVDESQRSRKKNKRKNNIPASTSGNTDWANETPRSLWRSIKQEVIKYFHYPIEGDCLDTAVEKFNLQKVTLLRSFCKKVGLQILLKDYNMDGKNKPCFHEDDVINMFPVVKHLQPKASDAYHIFTTGQQKIQQGLLRDGYELISEALNLLNNVYGAMHPEIAACARLLARLSYIQGDYGEALAFQQRAVLMSERVLGIDHPNTITEYSHLALYAFANNQIPTALKLLYHARYLILTCHGENHPQVALFDSNIGLMLHAVSEFDLSLKFLQKALELNTQFFGERGLKVAMSHHLLARAYSCKGDFRRALQAEKEAYGVYKELLGEGHERTKESSECLKHLTEQAVRFQKTMNVFTKGDATATIPPIHIQTPSLSNVLETLNLINGIVFLHISPEDIEQFRAEMIRRQQETMAAGSDSAAATGGDNAAAGVDDQTGDGAQKTVPKGMVDLDIDG